MGKKERVILIKGDESKWYEQVIFIVNQNTPKEKIPVDFVAEAERIIYNHIRKGYGKHTANGIGVAYASAPKQSNTAVAAPPKRVNKKPVKNKRFDFILNTIMAIGCFVIAAALLWGFFG